jgi:hypothetical protein
MRLSRVSHIRYANGSVDRFPANMRIKLPAVNPPEEEDEGAGAEKDRKEEKKVRTSSGKPGRQIEYYEEEDNDEYPVPERRAKPLNHRASSQRYEQDDEDVDSGKVKVKAPSGRPRRQTEDYGDEDDSLVAEWRTAQNNRKAASLSARPVRDVSILFLLSVMISKRKDTCWIWRESIFS